MKIVLASNNTGKVKEFEFYLKNFDIEILPQAALNVAEIHEDAPSFIENALFKARHASRETNLPALADDSGLCVNALRGAPGVHSARFAGPQKSSADNITKLLHDLKAFPSTQRQAYFICVLAFVQHAEDPTPIVVEGRWYGEILTQPVGQTGFGYDPVFFIPALNQSAAELSLSEKNKISHRGIALTHLTERFKHLKDEG